MKTMVADLVKACDDCQRAVEQLVAAHVTNAPASEVLAALFKLREALAVPTAGVEELLARQVCVPCHRARCDLWHQCRSWLTNETIGELQA